MMRGNALAHDEELLALFNADMAILALMISHDMGKVEHASDAIRYLRWHCRRVAPSDRVVKRLAEATPIDSPETAAAALTDMRERLAMLDAILTSAVQEAQDTREQRA